MQTMNVRSSEVNERSAILEIHRDAFGLEEGPEIATLVDELFNDETARPMLSLVAELDGRLLGHVLFTRARIRPEHGKLAASILAPLAVSSETQDKGIGGALVREGLDRLAAAGVDLVFVLGHPGYYPKFGFHPAGARGMDAPYPIPPKNADAWMVKALNEDILGRVTGTVECARTLGQPQYWQE